jgi:hypothetical protein
MIGKLRDSFCGLFSAGYGDQCPMGLLTKRHRSFEFIQEFVVQRTQVVPGVIK